MTTVELCFFILGGAFLFLGGALLKHTPVGMVGARPLPALVCLLGVAITGASSADIWLASITTLMGLLDGLSAVILTVFVYALLVIGMALSGYTARSRLAPTGRHDDGQRV